MEVEPCYRRPLLELNVRLLQRMVEFEMGQSNVVVVPYITF
jgi:hypothetical protein